MPWKEMSIEEIAKSLGLNAREVREKHRLIDLIIRVRKEKGLSQAKFAKKMGVTQGRVAQIESGIGTANLTFDVLLHLLEVLGYEFKIVTKKAA